MQAKKSVRGNASWNTIGWWQNFWKQMQTMKSGCDNARSDTIVWLQNYYATHGASEALFIERTVAGLNNDAEPPLANVADAMSPDELELLLAIETDSEDNDAVEGDDGSVPYVHPYVWKCVDDGDDKGCGAVKKAMILVFVQQHRQSQLHANFIAPGSPDIGKGIRADGWHCIDDGDKFGCGAVLSMESHMWCVHAYNHLMSPSHAQRVAEPQGEHSRHYAWKCVDDGDQQGCGAVMKGDVQVHRQSQLHAKLIAVGSPDLS
jgi:hypothetical protein